MYRRCVSVKEAHGESIWTVAWGPGEDIVSGAVDGSCKRWTHENSVDSGAGGAGGIKGNRSEDSIPEGGDNHGNHNGIAL